MDKINYTLITGATGGLGNAFCEELIKLNHNILISGTSEIRLKSLKDKLQTNYPKADIKYFACDLSNLENIDKLIAYIINENICLNYLVNNAGYITEGSFASASARDILQTIKVNCEGTIYLTKQILDNKPLQHKLNIITISSMAGNYPMPYMAIYSSTKAMLSSIMLALRHEYKNENVNILVVEPGAIATSKQMQEAIKAQGLKGKLSSVPPEQIARKSINKSLKGRSKYTPGLFNKLTKFVSLFTSKNFQAKIVGNMWKRSQEKRNIK